MRTPEQADADAAMERAIHQWNAAYYGAESDDGVIRAWSLVAEFSQFRPDGEIAESVLIAGGYAMSRSHQIGLLRRGLVRIEKVAASQGWYDED